MDKENINTIYIISKGRPNCTTARTLEKMSYPGEWYIVCGNNDETLDEYKSNWGEDRVLVFDWYDEITRTDTMDNFGFETMPSGAVPARNATSAISWGRGEKRHWQFDDDYTSFARTDFDALKNRTIKDGQLLFDSLYSIAEFGLKTGLPNVGFGLSSSAFPRVSKKFQRRVFNAHNMSSDPAIFKRWRGRLNDDIINAIDVNKDNLEYSFNFMSLTTTETQKERGGLTEFYNDVGTVRKTAYGVLASPAQCKMVIRFGRYHHKVSWSKICPKLIREEFKRGAHGKAEEDHR